MLFGFHGLDDMWTTGYVLAENGFKVVGDMKDATLFENENYSGKPGWGSPQQWCRLVNAELEPWKFHVVKTCLKKGKKE